METKSNSISYGSWAVSLFVLFILFSTAPAHEAGALGFGALTLSCFSVTAFWANRFGRDQIAKLLFGLGLLLGFGVTSYGIIIGPYAARARARANADKSTVPETAKSDDAR